MMMQLELFAESARHQSGASAPPGQLSLESLLADAPHDSPAQHDERHPGERHADGGRRDH